MAPRLAIVGGGPAGLTLGLLLHRRRIPFTLFDLRPQPTDAELAEPSGLLDLHEESGLEAIRACGLMDEFLPLTALCTQAMTVADGSGAVLHRSEGGPENRPEIARHDLTRLLLRHFPAASVRWGHKLVSAARGPSGSDPGAVTTLDFGPHGTQDFDLVVGADGAWSRVRALLTDVKPAYTGIQYLTATLRPITRYPVLAELLGTGMLFCLGAGNCIITHRAAQDSAILYLCVRGDDPDLLARATAQGTERLLGDDELFGTFTGAARELIAEGCAENARGRSDAGQSAFVRPLYALPAGHTWPHKAGATVIGDASHLMSPFAGEGVNLAMWDALDLAGVIAAAWEKSPGDAAAFRDAVDEPLGQFEKKMAERAGVAAEEVISNTRMMFAEDGAKVLASMFQGGGE